MQGADHRTSLLLFPKRPTALDSSRATWMPRERLARLRGLDGAEAPELVGLDRDPAAEADLARGAADERDTVRVERLVDRHSAGLGAGDGNTAGGLAGLLAERGLVALTQPPDDCNLHGELVEVEGQEPDNIL